MRDLVRSLLFIKSVHTAVFIAMNVFLTIVILEVIADQISYLSWLSITALLTESVVLIANGWRCPISIYAQKVGATGARAIFFCRSGSRIEFLFCTAACLQ